MCVCVRDNVCVCVCVCVSQCACVRARDRRFYTAKPVRSRLGTPGNFTVLSQVACVKPGGEVPRLHGAGSLGSREKTGLCKEMNSLHTTNVFIFSGMRE